jgi:hypothetical protein
MYNDNKKKVVEPRSFPDHLAPDEVKNSEEFGLGMAKAIESEWFLRSSGNESSFYSKRDQYHTLRLYARGEQDTKLYKDLLNGGDDSSYTNYDWRALQIVPKFVKLIVNQMTERLFDVKAEATDKFSTDLKESYKESLEDFVKAKPIMEAAKRDLGVDVFPPDAESMPQNQDEVELHMSLKYKPAIEIATEEAIKYTLELNDYDETQSKVVEDVVTIGLGAIKHSTDPTKGIEVEYVDPSNLVYAYPTHRNFRDVHYYGEVRRVTMNELKRISRGKFSDEEIKEISDSSGSWSRYHNNSNQQNDSSTGDGIGGNMVNLLEFTFKSTNTPTYKKKYMKNGGFRMSKKESSYKKKNKEYKGYDVAQKSIDVWYKGTLILGTELMFGYGLAENMIRPKGFLHRTIPNYIVYAPELYQNRTKSLVSRIVPYVDQMQQIHIKLQQLIAKSRPNGIYIDVDGLEEVSMGDGSFLSPLEVIKIYNQTGNVLGTSTTNEGDYNYGREPIKELKNGVVDGLDRLISTYNHYLNLLRDAIGIPQGADASMPHPDTLVGVQEQVVLNSNTATRHILDSSLNISERLGKGLSLRLKDIFKYSDLKKVYISAVGRLNVNVLESIKNYHLHDLGINIKLKPDGRDQQMLEANIAQALQQQLITLDDAIDIREISNIKLANELIKVRRIKREKEVQKQQEKMQQMQSQAQAQASQAAAQAKQMEIQAKAQADAMLVEVKSKAKQMEIEMEKNAKAELMEKEFNYNMTLKGIDVEKEMQRDVQKQKDKVALQDRGNSQDSKKIEQRSSNLPAMNFESSEDNIGGGIDLSDMGPT